MIKWLENLTERILHALGAGDKLLKLLLQLERFALVGGTVFLIDYALMLLLTEVYLVPYLASTAISFIVSNVINYILSVRFVFPTDESRGRTKLMTLFLALAAVGLGINQAIMWLMTGRLGVDYRLSKIIAAAIVAAYNFITRKLFLERKEG